QLLELAGPLDAVAVRQPHVFRDPPLRLGDGAAEVAAAHAELDGNVALVALVEDIGGAGVERDVGELAQRNIGVAAAGGDVADLDVAHRFQAVAILGRDAHGDGELAIRLQHGRRRGAAHGRLYHRVDVAGIKPVTGRRGPLHLDVEIGLS